MTLGELLKNCFVEANSALEILQREIFIRRMGPAAWQGESEQEGFHAEDIAEIGNDRDAATFSNERDLRVESFL